MRTPPFVLFLTLLAACGPAAASQTLYPTMGGGLDWSPDPALDTAVSSSRPLEPDGAASWTLGIQHPASLTGFSGAFTLRVAETTVVATLPTGSGCGLTAAIGVFGGWQGYDCILTLEQMGTLAPGTRVVEFGIGFSEALPVAAGDLLYFEVTSLGSHTNDAPTLFVTSLEAVASVTIQGLAEPGPGEGANATAPAPVAGNATQPAGPGPQPAPGGPEPAPTPQPEPASPSPTPGPEALQPEGAAQDDAEDGRPQGEAAPGPLAPMAAAMLAAAAALRRARPRRP